MAGGRTAMQRVLLLVAVAGWVGVGWGMRREDAMQRDELTIRAFGSGGEDRFEAMKEKVYVHMQELDRAKSTVTAREAKTSMRGAGLAAAMESMKRLRKKFVTDRRDFSKGGPTKHSKPQTGHADRLPGPEWSFVPEYIGSLRPGGGGIRWMGNCFNDTSSEVNMDPQHEAKVTISMHSPVAIFCEDAYFIATPFRYDLVDFIIHGKYEIKWGKMEGEELDDMTTNGVRIFRLSQSVAMTIVDTWETLQLFLGALTGGPGVPRGVAERNLKFLNKYANYEMKPVQSLASVDPSLMRSGDMIGVVRLDGLDPLIMWGTGSHLGHTAVLMRGSNGSLFVCESQSKGNYWPKDAIQRTEWSQWLEWAREADYNVVWMPLREDVRVKFNATSAMREFEQLEVGLPGAVREEGTDGSGEQGLRYGFYNLIFGWIDTPRNNFPYPLTPELLMVIFALADPIFRAIPSAPSIWNEAMEKRLGLQEGNYSTTEVRMWVGDMLNSSSVDDLLSSSFTTET
eukprot:763519-Hanusia_phi.AAC.4